VGARTDATVRAGITGDRPPPKNPFARKDTPDTDGASMPDLTAPFETFPEPSEREASPRILPREMSGEDAVCPPSTMQVPATTPADLEQRLLDYARGTLALEEWPAVLRAWQLAKRGHMRDLVTFDREWSATAHRLGFAAASRAAGRRQLNRLQGLRHERRISRYRTAIDEGRADGWHPLVFGVFLAVYHLPIRQGLIQYGMRSLGLLASAADRIRCLHGNPRMEALDRAASLLPLLLPALDGPGFAPRAPRRRPPLEASSPA